MMESATLLELQDVSRSYAAAGGESTLTILSGVNLVLAAGRRMAVVGPSGSGKSTLLNIMGTLDRPSSGRVLLEGRDLAGLPEQDLSAVRNRSIGFVFQDHHLLPQCTVLENVLIPVLAQRARAGDAAERACSLLDRVGLGGRLDHRPGQLSGGECQRVAVVRALINQPRLLLADEPTGSLDGANAEAMTDLLAELNEEEGIALVVVTHAERLAERMRPVYRLCDGQLEEA
jgi:ABC-type lipoprotein export system ATPase subunit